MTPSAANLGLARCATCALVMHASAPRCARCGGAIHLRKPASIDRTLAFLVAAAMLYVPANILPIVHVKTATSDGGNTIMSGVVALWRSGSWPLALIVFFASVFVPLVKLLVLGALTLSVRWNWHSQLRERATLYRFVEFIGRWSMLDVFVVALLTALVRLRSLATIDPGPGALAFAAVVILTMIAAQSFDERLLWDGAAAAEPLSPAESVQHE